MTAAAVVDMNSGMDSGSVLDTVEDAKLAVVHHFGVAGRVARFVGTFPFSGDAGMAIVVVGRP